MRVGFCLPALYPLPSIEQRLEQAATIPADSLWVPDHLLGTYHPSLWQKSAWRELVHDSDGWFDPYCLLARLSNTTDIPLGLSVTDGTRRKAIDVARSALTLQHMCKGGFNLGVGSGEAESLVPFGYPFERPVGVLEEFLVELRHILDTGRVPQDTCGRLGLPLESSAGKPRVWVAAHGPRMLRLTGEYADGWIPAWRMTAQQYAERRAAIARHATAAGRPVPECGLFAAVVLGESRSRLLETIEKAPQAKLLSIWASGEAWARHGLVHPAGRESRGLVDVIVHDLDPQQLLDLTARAPAELMEEVFFLGNTEELLGTFEQFGKAGLEHIVLGDSTGAVGGLEEVSARAPDLLRLCKELSAL
ncbi:MAG: LLM class flavin-dependent oxidoreductase [Deltaproteobacteria bacterium]|nr:LLM class flavin-dependent oxidoreductase [Deltaproteobacteria bacterium]MBW2417435.1 LLM class flavin-dependent oxidoreductase [Deltaproteobacteria bacterium]